MTIRKLPLDELTSAYGSHHDEPDVGCKVFHVDKPSVLVQAAGYLKYERAKSPYDKSVYFRGQRKLYPKNSPTLYRGITKPEARVARDTKMEDLLRKIRTGQKVLRAVSDHVQEPILQHYGLNTRWLDVVDNVWVALWFACHTAHSVGRYGEYLHFEKRSVRNRKNDESFAYILLFESAATPDPMRKGCFKDSNSETIDLRIAAPSQFVRPHAQHGLVVKALSRKGKTSDDFSSLLAGIIRVDLADALDWLGSGDLLNVHALFPPPTYDFGYQEVLKHITTSCLDLGRIQSIGA